ncbi:hypothetical protein [Pseudoalteromonas shioyasakiensis]|uniref:hypothetical protein n=1 Tax=Pseudoalteromonas shioyasakiensis TaxID=1190813 RepID=UPI001C3CAC05|nr:hypothetical protein [Pseudoalteromonas shioyasakiensis]
MKHLMFSVFILLMLSACGNKSEQEQAQEQQTPEVTLEQQFDSYQGLAWQVVEALQNQSTAQQLQDLTLKLISSSTGLFLNLKAQLPECEASLQAMADATEFQQQQSDDTEALKNVITINVEPELPEFAAPSCYHAQKLLLNPLAVYKFAQQADLAQSDYQKANLKMTDSFARIKQLELITAIE